jgi:mannose-6-phosphate isomerase-like protein (cupin superfamily)
MQQVQTLRRRREFTNPAYKDKATVLKTAEETNGRYSLGQLEIYPGGGNGLHVHSAFTETFTAVEGVLGVMYKNRKMYLQPGESFTIPPGTPHHFFNDTDRRIVCHVKLSPGHDGFEKGIAIAYGLAADGKTNKKGVPKSLTHLALIIVLTDTKPVGLAGWLMPLFRILARRAKRKGIEKVLLEKYYYEDQPAASKR